MLLLSPLFEEKRCAARVLHTCARELANAGASVLQPDLYATGNSAGRLSDMALARWVQDVRNAAALLQQRDGMPLYLLGCRAGALLAAQAAASGLSVARLILWQPVVSGRGYLGQLRTRRMVQEKLTGEEPVEVGTHEVEGQELSPALYAELEQLTLPAPPLDSEVRLLQCSFNDKLLNEYDRLLTHWGTERVRVRCLVAEPFWNPHPPGAYRELALALSEEVLS